MKTIVFDIKGDFAHFKRIYTTSSPLTYSFPPPPTLKGIIGAIYGASKEEYLSIFSNETTKLAIRIINPIKKIRLGINLINTKDNFWTPIKRGKHEARTQIRTEFLKGVCYRIYFSHSDNKILNTIEKSIMNHKSVFTVSLGLSELLADIEYVETFDFLEAQDEEVEISSIIPLSLIEEKRIVFEENRKYFKERVPFSMKADREVDKYEDFIFEPDGNSIKLFMKTFFKGNNGENIAFF